MLPRQGVRATDGAWNLPRAAKRPKHAFSLQNLYNSGTIQ
jgi:hypothetical protein